MDLTPSGKYEALRDEVRAFLAGHREVAPKPGGPRKPDQRARNWQALLVEHGYAARTVPRDYGGIGAEPDVLEAEIIADTFAEAGVSQGLANQGISMLVPTLLEVGTEEQRSTYIRPTIRGEMLWCQGYSEPGSGSDLASVQTRCVLDGDHFVINGQKIWTSSAHFADMMFLLCRTEPELPKHAGLSYLLLSMRTPGIEVRPLATMTGRAEFNEVFFTDVRVPARQLVMGRGQGWHVANITLKYERLYLGDANKLTVRLRKLTDLLQNTTQDGVPTIAVPEFRERLLRLQGEVMAWRAHHLRMLTEQAQGIDSGVKRLIVKYGGTMLLWRLSGLATDALGAAGLSYELENGEPRAGVDATGWQLDYMFDIGMIIGGGSSNIQKNVIGERGLGLPREPKAQTPAVAGRA